MPPAAPRKGDDGIEALGTDMRVITDTYIAYNINYLRNVIGVKLPPYA